MSAYALPGLFPPLPLEQNVGICSSLHSPQNHNCSEYTDRLDQKVNCAPIMERRGGSNDDVTIQVKEAKMDALQLIQSLAASQQSSPSKKRIRQLRRTADREEPSSPQEHAMQFDLDITFGERQYTIVRSLYRLKRLRQELVEELDDSKDGWAVPELPTLMDKGCGGNNQSFSLLTALLRTYAPALELWLQKIFRLVSTKESPTLTQFLLEPVCLERHAPCVERRPFSDGRRSSSLESIEEDLEHEE